MRVLIYRAVRFRGNTGSAFPPLVCGALALSAAGCGNLLLEESVRHEVRVHAVVLSDYDGGRAATITPSQVAAYVERANRTLGGSGAGIRLSFHPSEYGPDWERIRNTEFNNLDIGGRGVDLANRLASLRKGKMVVIFRHGMGSPSGNTYFPDPDEPAKTGFSGPPNSTRPIHFVAMPGDFDKTEAIAGRVSTGPGELQDGARVDVHGWVYRQNEHVLVHEVGHYLGLNHTFPGRDDSRFRSVEDAERYLRNHPEHPNSADAFDGDGLEDTAPDAGVRLFISMGESPCGASAASLRIGGIQLQPDRGNVMGYFRCDDQLYFSGNQVKRMRRIIRHPDRIHLVRRGTTRRGTEDSGESDGSGGTKGTGAL